MMAGGKGLLMLQAFKQFLSDLAGGEKDQRRFEDNDYRLAAAALLIHAAMIDGAMSEVERNRLVGVHHAALRSRRSRGA